MPKIYDRAPENPSFENDLKKFAKKEQHKIKSIYEAEVVPFLLYCLKTEILQMAKYREEYPLISAFSVIRRSFCIDEAMLIKFRIRFPNRGISAGGRLSAAVVMKDGYVVPLEIYTHGMRGNGDDTNDKELERKFKAVYTMIQK